MSDMSGAGAFRRGEEITVETTGALVEGKAIARLGDLVVFVDGAVPGELVRAAITKVKPNYIESRLVSVDRPSQARLTPRCRHFGTCGGCRWQHMTYESQLAMKEDHVREAFRRIGKISSPPIEPILGADQPYFYRNKMEYSFSDRKWLEEPPARRSTEPESPHGEIGVFLGLHARGRFEKVLDLEECYLQSDLSVSLMRRVRAFAQRSGLMVYSTRRDSGFWRFLVIRQSARTPDVMVNVVTYERKPDIIGELVGELTREFPSVSTVVNTINSRKAQIAFGEEEFVDYGTGFITELIGPYTFEVSASSFFQTNTVQAERLYDVTTEFAALKGTETVLDLYSGTGSIAMYLSGKAARVVGIEAVEGAIRDAERNARRNNVTNCTFLHGDLKDRLTVDSGWLGEYSQPNVIVLDPPRSGLHPVVTEKVRELGAPRIVYVSCNPATQARDVGVFTDGGYRLVKLQPVDMFPHTSHVENVALLTRS